MTSHPIPDAALDSDIAIIARKGSGKSYLARGLAERLLDLQRRLVIIDPLGAWWGLRSSADGQEAGYPVAVFGGDHGDMPLTKTMGGALAKLIAAENMPCVIDTSLMRPHEQGAMAIDLFEGLFIHNRAPLTIILEEADVFAPQNPSKDGYAAKVLHEVDRIARRGRARGLRLITLTQRPARLHKDVLSQSAAIIAMRLTSPHDQGAIDDWIKGNADASKAKEVKDSLSTLPVGTGWVWAPDLDILSKEAFPRIKTLDTTATPKHGEKRIVPKTLAQVDVGALREAMALDSEDEAEAPRAAKPVASSKEIAEAERRGESRGEKIGYKNGFLDGRKSGEDDTLARVKRTLASVLDNEILLRPEPSAASPSGKAPAFDAGIARSNRAAASTSSDSQLKSTGTNGAKSEVSGRDDPLLATAKAIHPVRMPWGALAAMCGRKARGGYFNSTRKRLIESGEVIEENGLVVVRHPPPAPEGVYGADMLAEKLPEPSRKMFIEIRRRPGIDVASLAAVLKMQPRGGHWNSGMATLKRNALIFEEDGLWIAPGLEGEAS